VQFPKRQLPKSVLAAALSPSTYVLATALDPQVHPSHSAQPPLQPSAPQRALPINLWKIAAWEIAHLGSCQLGSRPWESAFWESTKHLNRLNELKNDSSLKDYFISSVDLTYWKQLVLRDLNAVALLSMISVYITS